MTTEQPLTDYDKRVLSIIGSAPGVYATFGITRTIYPNEERKLGDWNAAVDKSVKGLQDRGLIIPSRSGIWTVTQRGARLYDAHRRELEERSAN